MVSAINLTIPALAGSELRPSGTALLWVVDGYVVVFACLLLPAGALADRFGRKGALLTGMALFTVGVGVCAAAPSVPVLLAGRVVSGIGAASVLPGTLALMLHGCAAGRRPRAIAVWASMTGVAAVAGNLGGGAAVQLGSWRALFLVTLPLGVVALLAVARYAPRPPGRPRPIALLGSLLLTGGCVALLYGLVSAPAEGWFGAGTLAGLGCAVVLLVGWAVRESRVEHPLLDPRLLRIPLLRASALGMAVLFVGMFALMYLNGQYLQYAKGYSVFGAGVRLLPMAAGLWLAPRAGVGLANRYGPRFALASGFAALTSGLLGAGLCGPGTPYPCYALCTVGIAAGCGLASPGLSDGIMASVPAEHAGLGSALQSVSRELGSALGVAVVGSVTGARFAALLPVALRGPGGPTTVAAAKAASPDPTLTAGMVAAFSHAMGDGLRVAAAVVAVGGAVAVCWLPGRTGSGQLDRRVDELVGRDVGGG
jgi:MFS family permease